MAQNRRFCIVFLGSLALTLTISFRVNAAGSYATGDDAVAGLKTVFGTPEDFAAKFEATVKDRSDQVVGLLIAASGFVYAVRIFR